MRRYPKYKDSGIPWLGQVPEHWVVRPLKSVASGSGCIFTDGDWIESDDLSEAGIRYLTSGNVGVGFYKEQGEGFVSEQTFATLGCQEVLPGDVLISRLNLPIGRACIVPELGSRIVTCVDNVIVRPSPEFLPEFLVRLLSSKPHLDNMETLGRGSTMLRISRSTLGNVRFALPTVSEQKRIAEFLRLYLHPLDSAIASQELMIELLKERRSAIITQAVTKGLDPKAKMKDSGVTWLGYVPAHWEVKGLKFLLSANQGGAWGDEPTGLGDTIVLRSTEQTQTGEWRIEDPEVRSLSETERKKTQLKKGDILVTKASGSEAHIGKASLVDDAVASLNAGYSNFMQRLRARPGIEPQLILFMLNSKAVRDQFVYLSNSTSGLGNISASVLNNVLVAEPPESEQFGIVEHIAKECRGIDSAINKVERMIELLKERRSALITQAVTGQIDVR